MIGVDTNVLVRFLVKDDPGQHQRARALLERLEAERVPIFISNVVLCELVWVLQRSYRLPKRRISEVLRRLANSRQVILPSGDQLLRALAAFDAGKGDFADYLIREEALAAGCREVVTFDRALQGQDGFSSL